MFLHPTLLLLLLFVHPTPFLGSVAMQMIMTGHHDLHWPPHYCSADKIFLQQQSSYYYLAVIPHITQRNHSRDSLLFGFS
mmetsp:Transcript_1879/g.2879  ORF Transcript_1879/g.2879 Transcript_1879/m.2879 type:complete len:80 (-) Transcript_1879:148-387(-)